MVVIYLLTVRGCITLMTTEWTSLVSYGDREVVEVIPGGDATFMEDGGRRSGLRFVFAFLSLSLHRSHVLSKWSWESNQL